MFVVKSAGLAVGLLLIPFRHSTLAEEGIRASTSSFEDAAALQRRVTESYIHHLRLKLEHEHMHVGCVHPNENENK